MAERGPDPNPAGFELAETLAGIAAAKLATEVVILDMRELVSYTDYLVVCSARNERQAQAITDEVRRVMKDEHGMLPVNPARTGELGWTVLDYMDCVLHVFSGDARDLYDLEELWYEAPKTRIESGSEDDGDTHRDDRGLDRVEATGPSGKSGTR